MPQGDRVRGIPPRRSPGTRIPEDPSKSAPQPQVVDPADRAGLQGDVAEDPGQPPLVLVLQIARGRPLVHPHRDVVLPRADHPGDVELLHQPAAGSDADLGAVHPHPVPRLHPVEAQQDALGPAHGSGQLERAAVVPGRVLVGHVGRLDRERVLLVRVDRPPVGAVTLEHPVRRHRDRVPAAVVEVGAADVRGSSPVGSNPTPPGSPGAPARRRKRQVPFSESRGASVRSAERAGVRAPDPGRGRSGRSRYLTAPSVRPPRQKRCSTIMAMASGMIDSSTPPVVSS